MTNASRRWDNLPYRLLPFLAVLAVLSLAGSARAASAYDDLRFKAQKYENDRQWLDACRQYDELIRKDRNNVEAREGYHRCYRQYQISRRHADRLYRETLTHLKPGQALDIYEAVLNTIAATYVDRGKTDPDSLFRHGLQELRYALRQEGFVNEHMKNASPAALEAFKDRLSYWPERKIGNRSEVRSLIQTLAGLAHQEGIVQNKAAFTVVLAMEFAFGACSGLDEYTLFLTPQHYSAVQAAIRGKFVGIGIDLAVVDRQLVIARVYPGSSAAGAALTPGTRILSIDQQDAKEMSPELAAERLRGDVDTKVELEVEALIPGQMMIEYKKLQLTRTPVVVPSVDSMMLDNNGTPADYSDTGYLRITHFQETTVQEVREALAVLHARGMKGLILDLRGNPGGAFMPAVKVAEMFLQEGVIVHTTSQFPEFKDKAFRIKGNGPALMTPVCVLIDSETASSAELLAGALKENRLRDCLLVGQTTFGKGSIQCIFPLDKSDKSTGGIRITVAKFTSPGKNPYTHIGVSPNVLFEGDDKAVLREGLRVLRPMINPMMGMMGM